MQMDDMDLDYQDDEDYHSAEVPQEKEKADKTPRRTVDEAWHRWDSMHPGPQAAIRIRSMIVGGGHARG